MDDKGRTAGFKGLLGLCALVIGIKNKTAILDRLEQYNPRIGHAVPVNRGQCHSVGIIQLPLLCGAHPITRQCKGIVAFENSSSFFHVRSSLWVDAQGVFA